MLAALTIVSSARADELDDRPGLSREMKIGIRYYEKGDDLNAMDRFMEVLTHGDPAERSMANEYINLITRRMNSGEKNVPSEPSSLRANNAVAVPVDQGAAKAAAAPTAPPAAASAAAGPEVVVEPAGSELAATTLPSHPLPPLPAAPAVSADAEPQARPDKAVMRKEIRARLRALLEKGLREFNDYTEVKVLMQEDGNPQAIAIPTPLLFGDGIGFQKDAEGILDALTKVSFAVGSAQVIILPEGTPMGDAKILDMRRTMGISAHLISAGVASPRVRVNLLNSQVDLPKSLLDFKGVIVMFRYHEPLPLVVDSMIGEEGGPPLSLGIYPESFRPDRGEGAIIEFSVQDPPAGLVSWKFQLLQPAQADGKDLAPLQEVIGGSPVFHQVFWNGHQNYFGEALPAGRYECVLTATDAKNRQRTLHRWIELTGTSGESPRPTAAAAAAPAAAHGAPPADLSNPAGARSLIKGDSGVTAVQIAPAGGAAPAHKAAAKRTARAKPKAKRHVAKRPAPAAAPASAAPAASASQPTTPPTTSVIIGFNANTHQLTPTGERKLAGIADTMTYYPVETLVIDGSAQSAETDAAKLAEHRAQMVAGLLINKYQVEPKRIQVASEVSDSNPPRVVVRFQQPQ